MAQSDTLSARVLWLVNDERTAFGLRTNDYERYRKHCANRVHKLRGSLKMTHGKGREFKKLPPITVQNARDGHIQLLLFEAERAWAYGQELLKQAIDDDDNALRRKAVARFRRALSWNDQMLALMQELFDAKRLPAVSLAEATAYSLMLHGKVLRHRDDFKPALANLAVARGVLDELSSHALLSRDQALATAFADEISPEIRYCAHELGRAKAYDIDGIVAELAPKHRGELVPSYAPLVERLAAEAKDGSAAAARKMLKPVEWEGTPVPIRNPELVDVFIRVQEAEAKLDQDIGKAEHTKKTSSSRNQVAKFDAVLLALSDAEETARKLLEAQQASNTVQTSAAGKRDMHFLHAYVVYRLLSRRIQRDLALIDALVSSSTAHSKTGASTSNADADARLYPAVLKLLDTVLQSFTQMRNLSIVDESQDLASGIEARLSTIKARRCLYLARSYAPLKRYADALTLTQSAHLHLREARTMLSDVPADSPALPALRFHALQATPHLATLESELSADELKYKRDWYTFNGGAASTQPGSGDHKPLFFDIALNYVQLPMDKLLERAGKAPAPAPKVVAKAAAVQKEEPKPPTPPPVQETAPARGGLSSLLGGWWGRK